MKGRRVSIDALRSEFSYDAETGILTRIVPRRNCPVGQIIGTINKDGYLCVGFFVEKPLVHRAVWAMAYGEWPSGEVDHINGVKTDNRLGNLRIADDFGNAWNRGLRSTNKTGFRGVIPLAGKYVARIKHRGIEKHLGTFQTAKEASDAYEKTAKLMHGRFYRGGGDE